MAEFTTSKCCDCHILHNFGNNVTQLEHSQKAGALIQVTAFQSDFTKTKGIPMYPSFQMLSVPAPQSSEGAPASWCPSHLSAGLVFIILFCLLNYIFNHF